VAQSRANPRRAADLYSMTDDGLDWMFGPSIGATENRQIVGVD
jgi:hypothetical protein